MPHTSLQIPQPCHESWDAMHPASNGRHCAACQKTVVDFTLKTDAEILAFLANAAGARTCGRFAAGQLERPLQRAAPAAPMARWRAWLAAAVAVWGVREGVGTVAQAQVPAEWRARYWGGPVPAAPPAPAKEAAVPGGPPASATRSSESEQIVMGAPLAPDAPREVLLRGVVRDARTNEGLPGATVLVEGTTIGASTAADGSYTLAVPATQVGPAGVPLRVSFIGYMSQARIVATDSTSAAQLFQLETDVKGLVGELVITSWYRAMPPAPWHPRALFGWGKYWLTRPFRR